MGLIGDNRHAPHFKLQQDLEAKSTQVDSITQNLNASKAALEFFFLLFFQRSQAQKVIQEYQKRYDDLTADYKQKTIELQTQQKPFTKRLDLFTMN